MNDHTHDEIQHLKHPETLLLSEIVRQSLVFDADQFWRLLKLGTIYVNNERQLKDRIVPANSPIRVHTKPRRYNCHFDWPSLIIFENDFFLVLSKPHGIPSHPTIDNAIENALTQTSLARKYPLFVTHRLDTLTSGLIVYAKKTSFAKNFNLQLQQRRIQKNYVALIESVEDLPQTLIHYMDPSKGTPKKLADKPVDGWPVCELEILKQKKISPLLSWVKIHLVTGRTHQIRAQMAQLRAPLLGDVLYGSTRPFQENAIALRSCQLEFDFNDQRLRFDLDEEFQF